MRYQRVFRNTWTRWAAAAAAVALCTAWGPAAGAETFRVDVEIDGGDGNPGDGTCGTRDGYCSLRAAIEEANERTGRDIIVLPPGYYRLDPASGTLQITDDLEVKGAGSEDSVIDGQGKATVFSVAAGTEVGIGAITIRAGRGFWGGGIRNNGGRLRVTESRIQKCWAESGGGLANIGGAVTVTNSVISGNRAETNGGGVLNDTDGRVVLDRSRVIHNRAGQSGGGAFNNFGTLHVITGEMAENRAESGGGLANKLGEIVVLRTSIIGNTARRGGGIANGRGGSAAVHQSKILENRARRDGGGISNTGKLKVHLTRVARNEAAAHGGGIASPAEKAVLTNTAVQGNHPEGCFPQELCP